MKTDRKTRKALYRFGLIFPLLHWSGTLEEREAYICDTCAREHVIPGSTKTTITRQTLLRWLSDYQKTPSIDTLLPRGRSDAGKRRALCIATEVKLLELRDKYPSKPIKVIVKMAEEQGVFLPGDTIKMTAIYQMFKNRDASTADIKAEDIRRFQMECANDLWVTDSLHGPKVKLDDGRKCVAICFAILDDKSRLCVYGSFYPTERTDDFVDCFWNACRSRGLPSRLHTDHGSCFCNDRVKLGFASLEIGLVYDRVQKPRAKGKIERFFRTVRDQFLASLPDGEPTLSDLNIRFHEYLNEYNHRPHSALTDHEGKSCSPLQSYLMDIKAVRSAPENLPEYFWIHVERTVSQARTVSIGGRLFQVPLGYSGKRIECRYIDPGCVKARSGDMELGEIHEVDQVRNGNFHRLAYGGNKEVWK